MKKVFIAIAMALVATLTLNAQIFYKVEGNGLKEPSYIFGTHHFAPEAMLDSLPQVIEAFKQTKCVVGELVMPDNPMELASEMQPYMMAPADSTLRVLIPAEQFAAADSAFAAITGGMRLDMFNMMKPAVAQSTVTAIMAQKEFPQSGQLDTYFQSLARRDSMQVAGLETGKFQASILFGTVPLKKQAETLVADLKNPQKSMESTRELSTAYMNRDADALWKIAEESANEADDTFFEILLNKRNQAWLEKLPDMMKQQPLFVAVGALHLYGDKGLVNGLRQKGFTVTPIL